MQPSIAFALFLAVSALPQTFTPPKLERQNAMREPAPLNRQNGQRPLNFPVPKDVPAPLERQNGQRNLPIDAKPAPLERQNGDRNLPVDAKPAPLERQNGQREIGFPKLERQNGVRLPEPEERQNGQNSIAGADQPPAPLERQNGQRQIDGADQNGSGDAKRPKLQRQDAFSEDNFVRPQLERQNGVRLPEPEESGFNAASQHDVAAAAADAAAASHVGAASGEHAGSATEHAPITAHEG